MSFVSPNGFPLASLEGLPPPPAPDLAKWEAAVIVWIARGVPLQAAGYLADAVYGPTASDRANGRREAAWRGLTLRECAVLPD